jgi:hypothetical protein
MCWLGQTGLVNVDSPGLQCPPQRIRRDHIRQEEAILHRQFHMIEVQGGQA